MGFNVFLRFSAVAVSVFALSLSAVAGMPRGAELMADEQDADPVSGVTTARGNAEIRIDGYRIRGRADLINVDPGRNQVQFSGHALITVGDARYESDQVTCSLDFETCTEVTAAASGATPDAGANQISPTAAAGAAVINP